MSVKEKDPMRREYTVDKDKVARIDKIKQLGNLMHRVLGETIPPCRELSIASTKLEEAIMWASKAISVVEYPEKKDEAVRGADTSENN